VAGKGGVRDFGATGDGTKERAARVLPELEQGYPEQFRFGIMPAYGLFARRVRELEIANFHVGYQNEDRRPSLACVDVDGLEIDDPKAQDAEGVPPARFEDVKGLVIRHAPVLQDRHE
jgi:hypothetical protein